MCVSTLHFLAPHPVPLGQHPPRILRFAHHIQAIKFSLENRVAARIGRLAAERLRTFGCHYNIASAYSSKSELKRCCCCHLTHKSKPQLKYCAQRKMKGRTRIL